MFEHEIIAVFNKMMTLISFHSVDSLSNDYLEKKLRKIKMENKMLSVPYCYDPTKRRGEESRTKIMFRASARISSVSDLSLAFITPQLVQLLLRYRIHKTNTKGTIEMKV